MPQKAVKTLKPKETRLSIRTSEPQKKILLQAARLQHANISQFVLQTALDAAQEVLADQTEFRLSPTQWKAFCERPDEPAKVIPALRDLFKEPDLARARFG